MTDFRECLHDTLTPLLSLWGRPFKDSLRLLQRGGSLILPASLLQQGFASPSPSLPTPLPSLPAASLSLLAVVRAGVGVPL